MNTLQTRKKLDLGNIRKRQLDRQPLQPSEIVYLDVLEEPETSLYLDVIKKCMAKHEDVFSSSVINECVLCR